VQNKFRGLRKHARKRADSRGGFPACSPFVRSPFATGSAPGPARGTWILHDGTYTYDLIVSAALDGILGDFDAVSVEGLGAGHNAFWGVETTDGASPVEVFRLYVVPEPNPGVLVALGLLALVSRACRARAGR
jgi:hypothetical protein